MNNIKTFETELAKVLDNKLDLEKNLKLLKKEKKEYVFYDILNNFRCMKSYEEKNIEDLFGDKLIKDFINETTIYQHIFTFDAELVDENRNSVDPLELEEIEEIEEIIKKHITQEDVDLTRYFWRQNSTFDNINKKVFNFNFKNIFFNSSEITIEVSINSKEKLSKEEIQCIKDNIEGQLSDGWGENLAQNNITHNNKEIITIIANPDYYEDEEDYDDEYINSSVFISPNYDVTHVSSEKIVNSNSKKIVNSNSKQNNLKI